MPRISCWISAFAGMTAAALLPLAPTALAQGESAGGYPSRPIKVIVPFTPGSVTDILARTLSDRLAVEVGQPVVVENRPGAGGTIGTGVVAKSAPDGYTVAVVSAGFAVTPAIYDKLPYDPTKDLAAVIPLANLPSVLFASAVLGVKSVQELIELARAKPGKLNYSSAGIGSASHVNAEKFRVAAGIDVVHVPLKGAPEMVAETVAGRTHFGFSGIVAVLPSIRDGRVLASALSDRLRCPTCRPWRKPGCRGRSSISGSACSPRRRHRAASSTSSTTKSPARCSCRTCGSGSPISVLSRCRCGPSNSTPTCSSS